MRLTYVAIDQIITRNIRDHVDFKSGVLGAFSEVIELLQQDIQSGKIADPEKIAQIVESAAVEWSQAALNVNTRLAKENGEMFVATDAFKLLMRAHNPDVYLRLLMNGMTPLPDEERQIAEMKSEAIRKPSRRRH